MATTKDFGKALAAKLKANPQLAENVKVATINATIAMRILELRKKAKLTQTQLAEKAGTQQSVISRIEDAEYDGHSIPLLYRIATALGGELCFFINVNGDSGEKTTSIYQVDSDWNGHALLEWNPTFKSKIGVMSGYEDMTHCNLEEIAA